MASSTTSNGVSHVAKTLPILSQINKEIHPDSEDRAYWWGALSEPLASLLQANQYDNQVQLHYLRWFYRWILPALGPRPVDGKPYYGAWITHDMSPLEYSLNWKEKSPKQTIRFTVEAVTKQAGTATDPINQLGAKEFMNAISKDVPGLDLTRFNHFLEATNVPDDRLEDAIAKHPAHFPRSRVWIAFDLEHSGNLVAKSYFLPHWLAIQSGIPAKTIVFDAIRASNKANGASYDGSIAAIESYLSTFARQEDAPQVGLLSNDCVAETPGSRLKVYFRSSVDTIAKAKDMYHLGGRLKGANTAGGLKAINDFWYHLFGLDSSDPAAEDKVCVGEHKCIFVYEMRSTHGSEPDIDVKFHIPMWQLGKTDGEISDLLASWFETYGHPDLAARYKSDLDTAFPKHGITAGKAAGTHTYLSITHTPKTGLYMTMYYSPKLPEFYF
ncbi:aromatic prenyltransferase [Biscogniauxia mediterranea]|nr:aromatic prenyltransferase [Biscogniauxia mediterranea]